MVVWHHGSMNMGLGGLWDLVMDSEALPAVVMGLQRVGYG